MPSIRGEKVGELSQNVQGRILEVLDEANQILPNLRDIDQTLYTAVHVSLAVAYTGGTSYMHTAVQGAAEAFGSMSEALDATVESWTAADETSAKEFE